MLTNYLIAFSAGLTPLKDNGKTLLTEHLLSDALLIMGVGFATVFIVLTIIYFMVQVLNKLFPEKAAAPEDLD